MNKKAQSSGIPTFSIALMIAFFLFLIGMANINFIKDEVTNARSDLMCATDDINDGAKILCLIVDATVPYFIIIILSAVGGIITARLLM